MEGHNEKLNKKLDKLLEKLKQPSRPDHKQQQNFHPRTVNLTNITFTKEEQALLDLGLQYNIQQPLKSTGPTSSSKRRKPLDYSKPENNTHSAQWPPKN
jgi:hypothetical protein